MVAMCEDWFQDQSVSENKDREPGRATHTDWRLIPTCSLLGKITGQVTRAGQRYGLPWVWVRVENFPPARNPHPRVRVQGFTRFFFGDSTGFLMQFSVSSTVWQISMHGSDCDCEPKIKIMHTHVSRRPCAASPLMRHVAAQLVCVIIQFVHQVATPHSPSRVGGVDAQHARPQAPPHAESCA